MFDSDFQEQMNSGEVIEGGVPLLEGTVVDETALPGPVDGEARIEDFHDDEEGGPEDDGYGYEDVV